ncbi:hypothetical protein HAX54_006498 [Datura stramonium]|uniref:Uncharacterized protein n=1 Tax=Datura stramonium TaxID=4076 RepID=A0ABS8WWK1_DATST|nr:hypothetical protein [Datura stramonium]
MSTAECHTRDEYLFGYSYGMLDLQLRLDGRTDTTEEKAHIDELYPLNPQEQLMYKIGPAFSNPVAPFHETIMMRGSTVAEIWPLRWTMGISK